MEIELAITLRPISTGEKQLKYRYTHSQKVFKQKSQNKIWLFKYYNFSYFKESK
jgi:hypothetical protein